MVVDLYNKEFYRQQATNSYKSAQNVIGWFTKNILTPNSVVDVGAGVGTWLKAWNEEGVKEIIGFDGNQVDDEFLYVPRKNIIVQNLNEMKSWGGKRYDLVQSLETAEHLLPEKSEDFINILTSFSDVVLFSAALPRQGGVNHINCQNLQFWVDIFAKQRYLCYDIIRPALLQMGDKMVAQWYIQNTLLFVKSGSDEFLRKMGFLPVQCPVQYYHADIILAHINAYEQRRRRKPRLLRLFSRLLEYIIPVKLLTRKTKGT